MFSYNKISTIFSTGVNFASQVFDSTKSVLSTAADIGSIIISDDNNHLANAASNVGNSLSSIGTGACNVVKATSGLGIATFSSFNTGRAAYVAAAPIAAKYVADTAIANIVAPTSVAPITAVASNVVGAAAGFAIAHPVAIISAAGAVTLLTSNREQVVNAALSFKDAGVNVVDAAVEAGCSLKEIADLGAERVQQINEYLNDTPYNPNHWTNEEVIEKITQEIDGKEQEIDICFTNIIDNPAYLDDLENEFFIIGDVTEEAVPIIA